MGKHKFMILLVSVIILVALAEMVIAPDANSTSCGTVNGDVTLSTNVNAGGTCFMINASSVTIDCAGYLVNYSQAGPGGGVDNSGGFDSVTVKNCRFWYNAAAAVNVLVFDGGSDNAVIINNTITGSTSNPIIGINFPAASVNANISNNNITSTSDGSHGVSLVAPSNAYVQNNVIDTAGGAAHGVVISGAIFANRVLSNNITVRSVTGSITNGILLDNSLSTTVSGTNIINLVGNNTNGILLSGSNLSVITSNIISTSESPSNFISWGIGVNSGSFSNNIGGNNNGNNITLARNGANGINIATNQNNVIHSNTITGLAANVFGIGLTTANNTNLTLNSITLTGVNTNCISITSDSTNNRLTNNGLSCVGNDIADLGGAHLNYLIYSNPYGEITWTDINAGGFLSNLTLKGNGGIALPTGSAVGTNIAINSNLAAVNTSAFTKGQINSSANITIYSLGFATITGVVKDPDYKTTSGAVTGSDCLGSSCTQLSYNSGTGTLVFNTTSFSSFTIQGTDPPAVPEFSDYAIILIMVVTIGGFLVMKKKEK
jgi:hypothetical protein